MWPRLTRITPYFIYLLLIGFHQVVLADVFTIWDVRLAMAPLMITLVSIYKDQGIATVFAAAAAFVTTTNDLSAAAGMMVVAAGVVIGIGHYKGRLNLDSVASRLALIFAGCLTFETARLAFVTTQGLFYTYLRYMIPSVVLTSGIGVVFLLFKDGVLSYTKFKQLF